jgi:hypothetical protein
MNYSIAEPYLVSSSRSSSRGAGAGAGTSSSSGYSAAHSDDNQQNRSPTSFTASSGFGSSTTALSQVSSNNSSTTTVSTQPCSACGLPMSGQFVRALGSVYHLDCFRCRVGCFPFPFAILRHYRCFSSIPIKHFNSPSPPQIINKPDTFRNTGLQQCRRPEILPH